MTRAGWTVLGLFLLAFAAFEAIKYGGWAVPLGLAGLIGPDSALLLGIGQRTEPGQLAPRAVPVYNALHHWLPPVVLLVFSLVAPVSHATLVLMFTPALAWLAHLALDRALGYGLRTRDGWQCAARPVSSAARP
ncbi:DUF4260 family protein [Prauserella cavernicola]|uniref:DUF4260 family protein n=1 Tax=Prauserella cavernicola TaxID=2800127 RepID=A0A934QLM2_9PSEU|nr:DUF4260 family protein [Prauserella cavernicola]MBK1783127.1 DUF4260 family protein [Prauserella cavernicola]